MIIFLIYILEVQLKKLFCLVGHMNIRELISPQEFSSRD